MEIPLLKQPLCLNLHGEICDRSRSANSVIALCVGTLSIVVYFSCGVNLVVAFKIWFDDVVHKKLSRQIQSQY